MKTSHVRISTGVDAAAAEKRSRVSKIMSTVLYARVISRVRAFDFYLDSAAAAVRFPPPPLLSGDR